jgi:hypothetical protein
VPDGIKNAQYIFEFPKKLAIEIKISSFFRKWLNTSKRLFVSFSMFVMSLKMYIMLDS